MWLSCLSPSQLRKVSLGMAPEYSLESNGFGSRTNGGRSEVLLEFFEKPYEVTLLDLCGPKPAGGYIYIDDAEEDIPVYLRPNRNLPGF